MDVFDHRANQSVRAETNDACAIIFPSSLDELLGS